MTQGVLSIKLSNGGNIDGPEERSVFVRNVPMAQNSYSGPSLIRIALIRNLANPKSKTSCSIIKIWVSRLCFAREVYQQSAKR